MVCSDHLVDPSAWALHAQVTAERCLPDPPLLRLEAEASQAYLSTLLHISAAAPDATREACSVEARLVQLCMRNLERFEGQEMAAENGEAIASECPTGVTFLLPTTLGNSHALLVTSESARVNLKAIMCAMTLWCLYRWREHFTS